LIAVLAIHTQCSLLAQTPAKPPVGIVLRKGWDSAMSEGVATMRELKDLLSGFGSPAANIGPAPGLPIYKGVTYLMPLNEAVTVLGLKQLVNAKSGVVCPGFPNHSLSSFMFNGIFEDGFDTLYIVADLANQVVAVEFANVSVQKAKTNTPEVKKEWVTFDFINTRIKGQTESRVRHGSTRTESTLCIDSVFVNPTQANSGLREFRYYNDGFSDKDMHPTRLYLPRPLVDLILYRISKSGN
jgi:hypothetical protein